VITRAQLEYFLHSAGIRGYQEIFADVAYALPSEQWLGQGFANALLKFFTELKTAKYSAEGNDCDDFARGAAWFAQLLHRRTPHNARTALAFGEFWYRKDSGLMHAINIALVRDPDSTYKPIFFEPQLYVVTLLSDREIQSCDTLRF
jgi:hypothetical protein